MMLRQKGLERAFEMLKFEAKKNLHFYFEILRNVEGGAVVLESSLFILWALQPVKKRDF